MGSRLVVDAFVLWVKFGAGREKLGEWVKKAGAKGVVACCGVGVAVTEYLVGSGGGGGGSCLDAVKGIEDKDMTFRKDG